MAYKYGKRYGKHYLSARGVRFNDGTLAYEVRSSSNIGYIIAEQYQDRQSSSYATLARQGVMLAGKRRSALNEIISDIDEFEDVPMCCRVGHAEQCYALPDGEVICPEGVTPPGVVFALHPEKVHMAGTHDRWLAEVAGPLAGNPICEFS